MLMRRRFVKENLRVEEVVEVDEGDLESGCDADHQPVGCTAHMWVECIPFALYVSCRHCTRGTKNKMRKSSRCSAIEKWTRRDLKHTAVSYVCPNFHPFR